MKPLPPIVSPQWLATELARSQAPGPETGSEPQALKVADVRWYLDGGIPAWTGPLETDQVTPPPTARRPQPWPADELAGADDVAELTAAGGVVIDARGPERYRGEQEPVDPRAGHIPGAINLPFADNLDDYQRFRPALELEERFSQVED